MEDTGTQNQAMPQEQESAEIQVDGVGAPQGIAGAKGNPAQEAAKEAMRKLKIKHQDGKEEEVDEEEVIKIYRERKGHQSAANKTLQEGKAAKKQAEQFIEMMKDKGRLFEAIKKLGHDPRKLSEEYLSTVLAEEMMDPREKELKHLRTELEAERAEKKRVKEAEEKKITEELKAKYAKDFNEQFISALKEHSLPPTKPMIAEMAKYVHRAASIGYEITAKEAAKLVREDIETAHRNLYGEADVDTLVKLLGEPGLQKVRQYDTSRLKDPNAHLKTPAEQPESVRRERAQTKRMTPQQWREYNRK